MADGTNSNWFRRSRTRTQSICRMQKRQAPSKTIAIFWFTGKQLPWGIRDLAHHSVSGKVGTILRTVPSVDAGLIDGFVSTYSSPASSSPNA